MLQMAAAPAAQVSQALAPVRPNAGTLRSTIHGFTAGRRSRMVNVSGELMYAYVTLCDPGLVSSVQI